MATKALTYVAQRPSRDAVSTAPRTEHGRGWRKLLLEEDARAIWTRIAGMTDRPGIEHPEQKAQEVFLHLLSTGRFAAFIERGCSDEAINQEILACITE
jgi:hypothetical protein